jgi:hypothetical protein
VADRIVLLDGILHRHHAGEDALVWPKLLTRAPEGLTTAVHEVERQHEGIDAAVQSVAALLPDGRHSPDSGKSSALADAIDLLIARLGEHRQLEEEQVMPLVEEHITASERAQLGDDGAADTPPEQGPLVFGLFMHEADPELVVHLIAHMPPEVVPILGELALRHRPRVTAH